MKNTSVNLTEGSILKPLLMLFLPIAFGIFFQQLYNTADAVIVGRYVGKEALAAVGGSTSSIVNLLVGFFTGISSGASVIIAQMYGADDKNGITKAVHTSIMLSIAGGLAIMAFILLFTDKLLLLMDTPEDIMDYSSQYLKIYSIGMIPSLIYNMGSAIFRAIGETKKPLYYLIVTCVINIVLDLVFILVFDLKVTGAAIATVISQVASAVMILTALYRSKEAYRLLPTQLKFTGSILKRIIYIGLPAGLQSIMYTSSNIIVQASINALGTDTIAAWAAYGKMDSFLWMTVSSLGVAAMTFAGQNYGAGKLDRIYKCIKVSLILIIVIPLTMGGIMLVFGREIFSLFNSDSQVISIGMDIMKFMVCFYITYVSIEVFSGVMRGVGDALIPTVITCLGVCALRIVWLLVAVPMHHTLYMVLASYPITWITTTILFVIYYFSGKWLKNYKK